MNTIVMTQDASYQEAFFGEFTGQLKTIMTANHRRLVFANTIRINKGQGYMLLIDKEAQFARVLPVLNPGGNYDGVLNEQLGTRRRSRHERARH